LRDREPFGQADPTRYEGIPIRVALCSATLIVVLAALGLAALGLAALGLAALGLAALGLAALVLAALGLAALGLAALGLAALGASVPYDYIVRVSRRLFLRAN
jgi:hypothetical protein